MIRAFHQQSHVGGTPLVGLTRLAGPGRADVLVKCEFCNPTGSHKDREYEHMIDRLEASGQIRPGRSILTDASTGNGGGALARAGRLKGYRVRIYMPEGMTAERKAVIAEWDAELRETPAGGFLSGAEEAALRFVETTPDAFYLDQSRSPMNSEAMRGIGREVVAACLAEGRSVDSFACCIGTGGTFSGVAAELRAAFPAVRTVGIEVDRSAPLYARRKGLRFEHRPHNLMGLGPGKVASNVAEDLIDDVVTVTGDEGWAMMRRLAEEEGIPAGPTSGANVVVALREAERVGPGGTVVTVLFDAAWKYGSIPDGCYAHYRTRD